MRPYSTGKQAGEGRANAAWFVAVLVLASLLGVLSWGVRSEAGRSGSSRAASTSSAVPASELQTASLARVRAAVEHRSAIIVDARPQARFQAGRIPGALNLPAREDSQEVLAQIHEFSQVMPVIVYCESEHCQDSQKVAQRLRQAGVPNVQVFHGGWQQWTQQGQAVERS